MLEGDNGLIYSKWGREIDSLSMEGLAKHD